jgi:dihydroflavonol-4-reductase
MKGDFRADHQVQDLRLRRRIHLRSGVSTLAVSRECSTDRPGTDALASDGRHEASALFERLLDAGNESVCRPRHTTATIDANATRSPERPHTSPRQQRLQPCTGSGNTGRLLFRWNRTILGRISGGSRMRVFITGGTGFVGSHTVAALLEAGHEVRLLVRSPERIAKAMQPLGVGEVDFCVGDATESESVAGALEGCEAAVHAASTFSFDPRQRRTIRDANVRGAEVVLGAAIRGGLAPVVHVSSIVALLPAHGRVLTPDIPPGHAHSPYFQSKAEQERLARRLQQDGAPIVIVQPGSVWGPHDPNYGESDQMASNILARRMPIIPAGGMQIVDVRDVAAAIARTVERDHAPRRYLLGGSYVTVRELVHLLAELTSRRLGALPMREELILPVARVADLVQRLVPFRIPLPSGGIALTRQRARSDDSRAHEELGFTPRDLRATVADTVRSLVETGRIPREQAGALAPHYHSRIDDP